MDEMVYLINQKGSDLYKIGVTKNINRRLKQHQTSSPRPLVVICMYKTEIPWKIEKIMHRSLKHKKFVIDDFEDLVGEWFLLDNKDVEEFERRCFNIEKNLNFLKENSLYHSEFKKL